MQRAIRRSVQLSKAKVLTNVIAIRSVQSLRSVPVPSSNFLFKSVTSVNQTFRLNSVAYFSAYPPHKVVPMPSLSPTMEVGSIAKWNLKEGDKFEAGSAICEVETDKATVSFDATDDGYIAKIFVGAGEVKVGQPLMITVEEQSEVAAFANYVVEAASVPVAAAPVAAATPVAAPVAQKAAPVASSSAASNGSRVFVSPRAKKLASQEGINYATLTGSGTRGRIVVEDVQKAISAPKVAAPAPVAAATQPVAAAAAKQVATSNAGGVFADFVLSDVAQSVAARQTLAKQQVPHYYLSVELNLTNLLALRENFNKTFAAAGKKGSDVDSGLSVQDFLIKAAALAMKQVPDVNASWMDTFVRRYHQVDINLIVGAGSFLATPVIRDVNSKGLSAIAQEVASFEDSLFSENSTSTTTTTTAQDVGTFSIHNLGIYGVKSAAPIVLTPQSCALSLGAIVDTVIPKAAVDGGDNWQVAPVLTATLSCDHRVVDGAVGAQWLAAYKSYVENPVTMLL